MCTTKRLVPIPDLLWPYIKPTFDPEHPEYGINADGRRCLRVDSCIVHALEVLWENGIVTLSSCCGDGSGRGVITLRTMSAATEGRLLEAARRGTEKRLRNRERRSDQPALNAGDPCPRCSYPVEQFPGWKHLECGRCGWEEGDRVAATESRLLGRSPPAGERQQPVQRDQPVDLPAGRAVPSVVHDPDQEGSPTGQHGADL